MGIGIAFAQGFADRAIQRRDEDRKAKYEELLRQREMQDWKTKEVFKDDLAGKREEIQFGNNKSREEQIREEKRLRRRESLGKYGVAPQFIDAFDGMDVTDAEILEHWQTHELDEDGKTLLTKEAAAVKRRKRSAAMWVDRYGYKGTPAEAVIIGLAEKTEDYMSEFRKNFTVDANGNVTPVAVTTAGLRNDGTDGMKSWQNGAIESAFSDVAFTPLTKLLGGKIQQVPVTNPVTGERTVTLKAQDAPGFYEWKARVVERASQLLTSGRVANPQAAVIQALNVEGKYQPPNAEPTPADPAKPVSPEPGAGEAVIEPPANAPKIKQALVTPAQRRAQDIIIDRLTQMSDEEFGRIPENEIEPHIAALKLTNPKKARELAERWDKLSSSAEVREFHANKQTREAFSGYLSMDAKQLALVPPEEMKPVLEKMRSVDPKRVARLEEKYSKARTLP